MKLGRENFCLLSLIAIICIPNLKFVCLFQNILFRENFTDIYILILGILELASDDRRYKSSHNIIIIKIFTSPSNHPFNFQFLYLEFSIIQNVLKKWVQCSGIYFKNVYTQPVYILCWLGNCTESNMKQALNPFLKSLT